MATRARRATALGIGLLAFFVGRKRSRQRRDSLQAAILADYARAGEDPEYMAEMAEIDADFAGALSDGLDDPNEAY
ncbi:MAG TPA: hypothetical protein VJT67_14580 [Longimicrobiaceae bacterium]|nr:hypothetical protein [Longimicrobiaceae bacterium]